ncbi:MULTISPECIES: enoyl-CoA hydratase/isomerase family protein [Peribacillus]|uniref:enoyl-CoA hydratase/isomerase family protein n=1 Tax=Peribacillus TaxID=2675229 RepID=UPI001F4E4B89|nr:MULTISPECIES: enoyl-CoA hydratase/isomerase family protein [unclassified Peribacillus]MCK1983554.1 enoyl-CoA hydratase/isomerase family protein [Peribacillus sp. Aquil_B1]MCK2006572.1 enoyl-CoA hydratase/isomerase family protein [Peribacillus sp. Aquil_B8]
MSRKVLWENQGRVAIIQLSNPPYNCVDDQFLQDFDRTLDEIELSNDIRGLVILSSNNKVFAIGKNGGRISEEGLEEELLYKILKRLTLYSLPTISIISGTAIGAGLEIALACDLRISSEFSKFGFYSHISPSSIGKACLIELTSPSKAKELIWFGQLIGAKEAVDIGIINRIFPDSRLINEGVEMANSIIQQKTH